MTRFQSACASKVRFAILGEDRLLPVLLEHLDEAAERQDADAVLRLAAAEADDLRAEADREGEDLDAEDLRPHEVPELVHEDEHRAEQGEVEEVHGGGVLADGTGGREPCSSRGLARPQGPFGLAAGSAGAGPATGALKKRSVEMTSDAGGAWVL